MTKTVEERTAEINNQIEELRLDTMTEKQIESFIKQVELTNEIVDSVILEVIRLGNDVYLYENGDLVREIEIIE